MAKTNAAFMSGVPELLILRLLAEDELYGYELVRSVRRSTRDNIILAEGVIYPALHSLEQRGLLKARERMVAGRNRVYYSLTASGRRRLQSLTTQWEKIATGINACLGVNHG